MEKSYKNYTLFIFIVLFVSCSSDKNINEGRIIANSDYLLEKNSSFTHEDGKAYRLWCNDSLIFLPNDPDKHIYAYNYDGSKKETIGVVGPAPWEITSIWYFNRDSDSTYWIHDWGKRQIKKHNYYTNELYAKRDITAESNLLYIGNNKFLIPYYNKELDSLIMSVYDFEKDSFIYNYNFQEFLQEDCGNLSQPEAGMYYEGIFSNIINNKLVYAFYKLGSFLLIDIKSNDIIEIKDFRQLEWPKGYMVDGRMNYKPKINVTFSCWIDDSFIYVLSENNTSKRRKINKRDYVDIYDINTAQYINSIYIPRIDNKFSPYYICVNKYDLIVYYNNAEIITYNISPFINDKDN